MNKYKRPRKLILFYYSAIFLPAFFVIPREIDQTISSPITLASIVSYLMLIIVTFYSIPIVIKQNSLKKLFNGFEKYYIIYAVMAIISSFYSSYFLISFGKAIPLLISILVWSILLYYGLKYPKIILYYWELFLKLTLFWIVLLWFSALSDPNKGFILTKGALLPQIIGSWFIVHPNTSAQLSAIISTVGLIRLIYKSGKKIYRYLYLIIGLLTLLFTQARTSIVAFLIATIYIYIYLKGKYSRLKFPIIVISFPLLLILIYLYKDTFALYFARGQSLELFLGASGRVFHWLKFFEFITSNIIALLFGYWIHKYIKS